MTVPEKTVTQIYFGKTEKWTNKEKSKVITVIFYTTISQSIMHMHTKVNESSLNDSFGNSFRNFQC